MGPHKDNPEEFGDHAKTGQFLTVSLTAVGNTIHSFIPPCGLLPSNRSILQICNLFPGEIYLCIPKFFSEVN